MTQDIFEDTCVIESYSKDESGKLAKTAYTAGNTIRCRFIKRDGGSSGGGDNRTLGTARVAVRVLLEPHQTVKPNDRIRDPSTGRRYRVLDVTRPKKHAAVHHIVALCDVYVSSGT